MDTTLKIIFIISIITNSIDLVFRIYDIIKNKSTDVSDEEDED